MIDKAGMTVLLVDDMPNMINSIRGMMKILGFGRTFLPASNGEEALRILKKEPADMAIVDYDMPVMNGIELLREIRDDRDLRDLPVVMVTAQAYRDFVAEAGESVVGAYILKPVTVKVLADKVSAVIENANNPPPMVYHLKLARNFEEKGEIDLAIDETRLAMEANPKASRPVREMGYYYYKKDDLKGAEKWLLKAARMNSMDVFAFHYLGELYLRLDNIEKASYYFEKAMAISPRHLSRGVNFGKTLIARKEVKKAAKVFEKTFQLSENPIQLREEVADLCIKEGAHEYAVKLLEYIIREEPGRKDLFFDLGKSLEKLGDFSKAVTHLVNAEVADNENAEIKLHIAKSYLTLGKPLLAERPLKEILKKTPDNRLAKELLDQCLEG